MRDLTKKLSPHIWGIAVANLLLNILIVGTGGAVRLTGSGLGCPTWPKCTSDSLVATKAMGINGAIEFGNRTITFVLTGAAILLVLAALGYGAERVTRLAVLVAAGIPAQAILGGITVLTGLNPWLVAGHLLISMWIIAVCVSLLDALRGPVRPAAAGASARLPLLIQLTVWIVLALGTIVTGSGPHAGDSSSDRLGFSPAVTSMVHSSAVFVLIAFTLGMVFVGMRAGRQDLAQAAGAVLGIELLQGAVGFAQYFLGLPPLLVGLHMVLAACLIAASTWLLQLSRERVGIEVRAGESTLQR